MRADAETCKKERGGQYIDIRVLQRMPRESEATRSMQSKGKCRVVILLDNIAKLRFNFADGKDKIDEGSM